MYIKEQNPNGLFKKDYAVLDLIDKIEGQK